MRLYTDGAIYSNGNELLPACQARVEKAVAGVPGVTSCAVSLLTNSMGVEGEASQDAIIKAVEAAGHGASRKREIP